MKSVLFIVVKDTIGFFFGGWQGEGCSENQADINKVLHELPG